MADALTAWLLGVLPSEAGPALSWTAANLDAITPLLVVLLALGLVALVRLAELVTA